MTTTQIEKLRHDIEAEIREGATTAEIETMAEAYAFSRCNLIDVIRLLVSPRRQMDELVGRARALIRLDEIQDSADPHCAICHRVAEEFQLYDAEERFPIWLSRIVAGEISEDNSEV
jgi:hypothetical protein